MDSISPPQEKDSAHTPGDPVATKTSGVKIVKETRAGDQRSYKIAVAISIAALVFVIVFGILVVLP